LIGLGSGLAGSVLTVSHERAAEFRSRMLLAAEDFLRRAETMRALARGPGAETSGESVTLLLRAWDDLVPAVILVELLFGHDSDAAIEAREVGNELRDVERALRAGSDPSRPLWLVLSST
jgi:hypothetical protein